MPEDEDDEPPDPVWLQAFLRREQAIEDEIASMKPWHHSKSIEQIYFLAGHPLPVHCGCRMYRRSHATICECSHDYDWHEEGRECWVAHRTHE